MGTRRKVLIIQQGIPSVAARLYLFSVSDALEALKMGVLGPDNPEVSLRGRQNDAIRQRQSEITADPGVPPPYQSL